MAVKHHIDVLQRGVIAWNKWRIQHPDEAINLSGANLSGANLSGADLSGADLSGAWFTQKIAQDAYINGANLSGANLSGANLSGAILIITNLSEADLSRADLSIANLSWANLNRANLSNADIRATDFGGADLSEANLSNTITGLTHFDNLDLSTIKGLEHISHYGPSYISTSTLERSGGDLPDIFLRGAGLRDESISYAHSFLEHPIQFYSCFISYSSIDQEFAEQLYATLQSKGVRCWYAPHHMKTGDEIRKRINESIRLYDKLLLILSQHSIKSDWVKKEVETALSKERRQKKLVLFPLKLDETITRTRQAWATDIRNMRHITDFTHWKDHDAYKKSLDKLLDDMQTSETKKKR